MRALQSWLTLVLSLKHCGGPLYTSPPEPAPGISKTLMIKTGNPQLPPALSLGYDTYKLLFSLYITESYELEEQNSQNSLRTDWAKPPDGRPPDRYFSSPQIGPRQRDKGLPVRV